MAKMIPSVISENVKSNGEKKIYEAFQNQEKCDDWVVFHSFGIENHLNKKRGEVDFIVVAPKYGVFFLEVKGGRVRKEDGWWIYTDNNEIDHYKNESPFEQAKSAMYSVLETLREEKGIYFDKNFIWGYGVMFPDITFNIESFEYNLDQVYDEKYRGNIVSYIKKLSEYYRKNEKFECKDGLNQYYYEEILKIFKANFDIPVPIKTVIEYSEGIIYELTQEQYHVIDGLSYNDRCVIHGGAGTGKTILSTYVAKESIKNNEKVALFCYNLLLSKKLKKDVGDLPNGCYIGSFTEFMEQLVSKYMPLNLNSIENKTQFYREELPCLFLEIMEKENILFDRIIIDESQDLANDSYLDIMDMLLKNGLRNGKWAFFGDYEIQTIFYKNITFENFRNTLRNRQCFFATYKLVNNCRNTLNIQKEMKSIIPEYDAKTLNTDSNSPKVKKIKYTNQQEMIEKVNDEIRKLINNGILKEDIVILSPYVLSDSVLQELKNVKKYEINDNSIRYSTISGFKGLESKIVFLINIYEKTPKDIYFTGCSRARTLLYIFERKA